MKKEYRKPLVRIEKDKQSSSAWNLINADEKGTIMVNGTECSKKGIQMRELGGKESETV